MILFSENQILLFLATLNSNKLFFRIFENTLKSIFYIFRMVIYG